MYDAHYYYICIANQPVTDTSKLYYTRFLKREKYTNFPFCLER